MVFSKERESKPDNGKAVFLLNDPWKTVYELPMTAIPEAVEEVAQNPV